MYSKMSLWAISSWPTSSTLALAAWAILASSMSRKRSGRSGGWLGVIQPFKGRYSYRRENTTNRIHPIAKCNYSLDVQPGATEPVQQAIQIKDVTQNFRFTDAPSIHLSRVCVISIPWALQRASRLISCAILSSCDAGPTQDPATIWYIVGSVAKWTFRGPAAGLGQ